MILHRVAVYLTVGLCLVLAACTPDLAGSSNSIHRLQPGSVVSGTVRVGVATIILPEGDWTIVSTGEERRSTVQGTQSSPDAQVMLMRFNSAQNNRVEGVVYIVANLFSENIIWNRLPQCFQTDWLAFENNYSNNLQHDCWYVRAWRPNWQFNDSAPAFERRGVEFASRLTTLAPLTFIGTRHFAARRNNRVDFLVYASTTSLGETSFSTEDWHQLNRGRAPARERVFQDWLGVSRIRHSQVIAGLEGRIPQPTARPAIEGQSVPSSGGASSGVAERLRNLEDLKSRGLINDQEYQTQRQRILQGL